MTRTTKSASGAERPIVVRASAGSGKTYALTNQYLKLLLRDVEPDTILATTFTRKAAGEILVRVVRRLAEASTDDKARSELAAALGVSLSPAQCTRLLRRVVSRLHRLRIGTLDSFFAKLAGSFSLELNLPPGWRIVEELDDQALRDEAIEAVLAEQPLAELLTLLNLLTKGDAQRSITELIRSTVAELYVTFREAPPEAWRSVARLSQLTGVELTAAIDQLATLALPNDKMAATRDCDLAKFVAENWDDFLKAGLAKKVASDDLSYYKVDIPPPVVDAYRTLIRHIAVERINQAIGRTEGSHDLLAHFQQQYRQRQQQRRALRFDDITFALAGAEAAIAPEHVAFRLDGGVDHLLLDEFQDTSLVQWRVLRPLARRVAESGAGCTFFCVGDMKQAIYGWRGGLAEIFGALDSVLPDAQTLPLDKSWRSSQPVIDTVNQVFQQADRFDRLDEDAAVALRQWVGAFPHHTTAKTDLPGYAQLETSPLMDGSRATKAALFSFAARRVAELHTAAPTAKIGVLARRNSVVARMMFELRRLDWRASEEGGNPLIDSPAVELLLSLAQLSDHPGDTVRRFHLATSPLGPLLGLPDHRDSAAAIRLATDVRRELLDAGYGPTVERWARLLAPHCDKRDQSRLQQLVELAYEHQPHASLRASDFVALVESQRVGDPAATPIVVTTFHQSKGLEYDIVVLPELDWSLTGQPPSVVTGRPGVAEPIDAVLHYVGGNFQSWLEPETKRLFTQATGRRVAESLCTLYVALTRAAHALYMIVPPSSKSERILPKSAVGLLRAALTDGGRVDGEQVVFQTGDPLWMRKYDAEKTPHAAAEPLPPAPRRIELRPPAEQPRRGWLTVSPSSLEGGDRVRIEPLFQRHRSGALTRGSVLHAWLEQIGWLDDGPPDDALLRPIAARLNAAPADCDAWLEDFRRRLAQPLLADWLHRESYARAIGWAGRAWELRVRREASISVRDDDHQLLGGFIDRLVLAYEGERIVAADVIDYKTDRLDAADEAAIAERVEFYRPQLAAYRQAVARLTRLPAARVGARLMLLELDRVVELFPVELS